MIVRKTDAEVDTMARAGTVVAATLDLVEEHAAPGVTLAELDRIAEEFIGSRGGRPTFKGYRGFPGSICASPPPTQRPACSSTASPAPRPRPRRSTRC